MILSYSFENFCSFKNATNFSMKPGKVVSRFSDNVYTFPSKLKVSKIAVIVGENAGGKSNFIRSLHFFKYIFSISDGAIRVLKNLSFLNTVNSQNFEISIAIDNTIYTYNVTIGKNNLEKEALYIRKTGEKEEDNISIFKLNCLSEEKNKSCEYKVDINNDFINPSIKKILDHISNSTENANNISRPSVLFINYLSNIGLDIVNPFIDWINNKLIIDLPSNVIPINVYKQMEENEENLSILKEKSYFEIFSLIDPSITNIKVDDQKPFEDTIIVRKLPDGNIYENNIRYESSGIIQFYSYAIDIWKVIYEDCVLFADEIDSMLNIIFSERVLKFILGSTKKGQFIFTTHNIFHLNTDIFMKEEIFFSTKNLSTLSSELYSLADFEEYRYEKTNVYELYLKGLLGSIPHE